MSASLGKGYDVAIVGGGLVGAAIGWGLANVGQKVAVLDEGDLAYRASRGNFALVWVQSKGLGMPQYAAWTKRSSDGWGAFAARLQEETGFDVAFERRGGFQLALSEAELESRVGMLRRLHNQRDMVQYPYEVLNHAEVARMLPEVGPEVVGGSYCPLDGHCNSLRLLRALHVGMNRMGVRYLPNHRVEWIKASGDEFHVATEAGEVSAAKLVLAAGNGNAKLAPMVGLKAPVRPQRGHIVVSERVRPFLKYPVSTVRQTDEGSILIGDSLEEAGFDDTVDLGVASTMANRAVRMFPLIRRLNVVRTWAALRVMTADGFPIYEQSVDYPGAFITTCHSGVTLAANHALVLAPMLAAGKLSNELDVFSARRFDVPTPS